jgi:hypothetical protein
VVADLCAEERYLCLYVKFFFYIYRSKTFFSCVEMCLYIFLNVTYVSFGVFICICIHIYI